MKGLQDIVSKTVNLDGGGTSATSVVVTTVSVQSVSSMMVRALGAARMVGREACALTTVQKNVP